MLEKLPTTDFSMQLPERFAADKLLQRARGFLKQTYPLSQKGASLGSLLSNAIEGGEWEKVGNISAGLPTYEQPHPELFSDLVITSEQRSAFFGPNLANIQTTKGCTHNCNFCCLDASRKLETMPFAGIQKIGVVKKQFEEDVSILYEDWVDFVMRRTGVNLNPPLGVNDNGQTVLPLVRWDQLPRNMATLYREHPLSDLISPDYYYEGAPFGPVLPKYGKLPIFFSSITNYYDSDPFDYVHRGILHEDGSPIDYGDVVRLLVSDSRQIFITTAGWVAGNIHAKHAAEKIVDLYTQSPHFFDKIRVSVNRSERRAERNMDQYLQDMKETIWSLRKVKPEILIMIENVSEQDRVFFQAVVRPLLDWLPSAAPAWTKTEISRVSHFSGRAYRPENEMSDHDVARCMPGIHIQPSGGVYLQDWEMGQSHFSRRNIRQLIKGQRPTPTNIKIFP